MNILIDARGVQRRSDGMSNYIRHLLTHLAAEGPEEQLFVLCHEAYHAELSATGLADRPNVHPVPTHSRFMGPAQQVQVPLLVRRLPLMDVYHYPHFDAPLFAHPRLVVTIYDLNHLLLDSYFDSLRPLKRFYSQWLTAWTMARARHVITISEATRQSVLARFPGLPPERVTTIHFGLNAGFEQPVDESRVAELRRRFHLGADRFVLYVGTMRPHKNLARVLEAFGQVKRSTAVPHKLLLVGSQSGGEALRQLVRVSGLEASVVMLNYLPDELLPAAYRVADAFVFCSLSEGFGMPLLEAMASGVPIVASNQGAVAEVAGSAAVLVDPRDVGAIADGLSRLLAAPSLQKDLVRRGHERLAQFSWRQTARATLAVYRRVGGRNDATNSFTGVPASGMAAKGRDLGGARRPVLAQP